MKLLEEGGRKGIEGEMRERRALTNGVFTDPEKKAFIVLYSLLNTYSDNQSHPLLMVSMTSGGVFCTSCSLRVHI